MNGHEELLEGENIDPHDAAALREALHDQLCMDAALSAYFGDGSADDRVCQSVMAALQSDGEAHLQRRVMQDRRLLRPHHTRQTWAAGLALTAAAVMLCLSLGWWLLHAPLQPAQRVDQAPSPPVPPVPLEISQPVPSAPAPPPVEKAIAQTPLPKMESQPSAIPVVRPSIPDPRPQSSATAESPPPEMNERSTATTMPAVVAAKPAPDTKPSLGTPPPPAALPPAPAPVPARRDPAQWPFSASSPWNMPVGSDAKLDVIVPAEFAMQTIGFQPRTIFIATDRQSIVSIKRPGGAAVKLPFAREWADALSMRTAPVTIIGQDGQRAFEYHGLRRDGDDWSVADITRISLLEDGTGRDARGLGELGLPALAGVIRSGEWQGGIHHVVSIVVPASLLSVKAGGRAAVWPAQPEQEPDASGFMKRGNLHLGSLLALPLGAHPAKLGLAEGTPQYQIALALWNHGACIVGSSKEGRGGISLLTETLPGGIMDRDAISRVLAQLRVVTNHSSTRPGGGGKPRCALAPAFTPAK